MQALTPVALPFACASARPLRSVGCRRRRRRRHPRSPQSPLRMHWRSPRRGTLRQTRLVFALHPSPPRTASPGSGQGCPAFRPFGRFSPVAAETSLRKCRPSEPPSKSVLLCVAIPQSRAVAAECATPTPSLIRLRRTGGKSPRRACFVLRRRVGPCGRRRLARTGVALRAPRKDSTSPDNTTNNQTHLPQDRQDPDRDPGASRPPSLRPGAFTPRCTGRATAKARCHARCWALRSPHAPAFGLVSVTFRPEARKEVGASVRKVLFRFNNLADVPR